MIILLMLTGQGANIGGHLLFRKIVDLISTDALIGTISNASFKTAAKLMGLWTVTRFIQSALIESTRYQVWKFVQQGIRNLYRVSFDKLLALDIGYHKEKSKNTGVEINKALKSLEQGLFYLLSDTAKHAVEFLFIGTALFHFCGPKYFLIFLSSFMAYTYATYKFT